MDEPTKAPNPNSLLCETHNLRHGPAGCPICLRFAGPRPIELLPAEDRSVHGVEFFAEFWRHHGMKSVGLLALGLGSVFFFAMPRWQARPNDPAPYRQAIVDLESVLFYAGPSDAQEHPQILVTLIQSLLDELKAHPVSYKAEYLTLALEEEQKRVKGQDPATFRLIGPRRNWVQIREAVFDDAVWFRLRDDQLDVVQGRLQGEPPPGQAETGAMDLLDAYFRGVERFVARAGDIAAQACNQGSDRNALNADIRSLSADTLASLDLIVAGNDEVKALLSPVTTQARSLVRARRESSCGVSVPSSATLSREFAAFEAVVQRTRTRLETTARPRG